jgi:hypothetical protein
VPYHSEICTNRLTCKNMAGQVLQEKSQEACGIDVQNTVSKPFCESSINSTFLHLPLTIAGSCSSLMHVTGTVAI